MARKKKSNNYFTKITDIAISAYNRSADFPRKRERIYKRFIYPAFLPIATEFVL